MDPLVVFLQRLDFENIKSIRPYKQGQHNKTYKVVSSREMVSLRVYRYKKPSQIQFEIALLQKIKSLPVPHPVKRKGQFLHKFDGKWAMCYAYLPGTHRTVFTTMQLNEVGKLIAR